MKPCTREWFKHVLDSYPPVDDPAAYISSKCGLDYNEALRIVREVAENHDK